MLIRLMIVITLIILVYIMAKDKLNLTGGNATHSGGESQSPDGSDQTRGVRNNNPLNIEYNRANDWQGQTGSDGRFAIFSHSKWGFRAAAKLLQNYQRLYGLNTVNELINRWAPPVENHTSNYVNFVAGRMGVGIAERIDLKNKTLLTDLVHAMSIMESGHHYTRSDAAQGVNLV